MGSVESKMIGMNGGEIWTKHGVRLQEGAKMTIYMRYETKALHHAKVMHRCLDSDTMCDQDGWEEVDDVEWEERDDQNIVVVNHGWQGEYKVIHDANAGAIAGIVVGSVVFVCAICGVAFWQLRK